jgi:hypothetical protein
MNRLFIVTAFLLAAACDSTETCETPAPAPVFRDLDDLEYYSYIDSWNGQPIHASEYAAAITECAEIEDPELLLSLSGYEADATTGRRVAGVASSMYAHAPLWGCLVKRWAANDAIDLLQP